VTGIPSEPRPSRSREHLSRGLAFLVVGGLGFLVDAAVFNALVYWAGEGPLFHLPLVAKVIAIAIATIATYYGNAWLTYRDRSGPTSRRGFVVYFVLNVVAILLQLACLGFSRYVLGLADPVADNISGTLVGQALATIFRYITYGRWVFPPERQSAEAK
jgi:putative flippase GtrA